MIDVWFFDVNYAFSCSKTYLSKRLYLRQTEISMKENSISKEQYRKETIHNEQNTINRGETITDIYMLRTYTMQYSLF
jgi:cell division protein FtsL